MKRQSGIHMTQTNKEPTIIELEANHTAFVLDEHGNLVEFYMPDQTEDKEVPQRIVEMLTLCINAADLMSDKGYELGTHEEQAEFDAKRDYKL